MGKFLFCVTAKVLADLMENNYLPFSAKIQADPFVWILIKNALFPDLNVKNTAIPDLNVKTLVVRNQM